jgi:hypothetical protein
MRIVTIRPVTPAGAAVAVILSDFENLAGGEGGWETLDRPRRAAAAGWVGLPEKTLTLPVTVDGMDKRGVGLDDPAGVATVLNRIDAYAQPARATGEPPILQIVGVPRVSAGDRWVLQSIDRGEYVSDAAGRLIQAQLTLTLLRYLEAALVKGPAAKARAKKGKGKGKKKAPKKLHHPKKRG